MYICHMYICHMYICHLKYFKVFNYNVLQMHQTLTMLSQSVLTDWAERNYVSIH